MLEQIKAYKDAVEVAAKAALALLSLAFALGLLIVNFHLRSWGISQFSLLQVEYVIVGFTFVFLIAIAAIAVLTVQRTFGRASEVYKEWRTSPLKSALKLLMETFLPLAMLPLGVALILDLEWPLFHWRGLMALFILGYGGFLVIFWFRYLQRRIRGLVEPPSETINYASSQIVGILFYASLYASFVYPHISPVFAGGQTRRVILMPSKGYADTLKTLGYKLTVNGTTGPLELIIETQDFLLIRPESNDRQITSVRIRRDGVEGIFYLTQQ